MTLSLHDVSPEQAATFVVARRLCARPRDFAAEIDAVLTKYAGDGWLDQLRRFGNTAVDRLTSATPGSPTAPGYWGNVGWESGRNALIGGAVGAGGGLLSELFTKRRKRRPFLGALAGGALGAGLGAAGTGAYRGLQTLFSEGNADQAAAAARFAERRRLGLAMDAADAQHPTRRGAQPPAAAAAPAADSPGWLRQSLDAAQSAAGAGLSAIDTATDTSRRVGNAYSASQVGTASEAASQLLPNPETAALAAGATLATRPLVTRAMLGHRLQALPRNEVARATDAATAATIAGASPSVLGSLRFWNRQPFNTPLAAGQLRPLRQLLGAQAPSRSWLSSLAAPALAGWVAGQ